MCKKRAWSRSAQNSYEYRAQLSHFWHLSYVAAFYRQWARAATYWETNGSSVRKVSRAHEGKILALSPDDRVIIPRARGSNRPIERAFQPPAIGRNRSGRDQAGHTKNSRKQPCAFHFHQNPSLSLAIGLVNHINETGGRFLAAGLFFLGFFCRRIPHRFWDLMILY